MADRCLCPDFDLRGQDYEIWRTDDGTIVLVDPRLNTVVDTDTAFTPPLSNEELLAIYDYGRDY